MHRQLPQTLQISTWRRPSHLNLHQMVSHQPPFHSLYDHLHHVLQGFSLFFLYLSLLLASLNACLKLIATLLFHFHFSHSISVHRWCSHFSLHSSPCKENWSSKSQPGIAWFPDWVLLDQFQYDNISFQYDNYKLVEQYSIREPRNAGLRFARPILFPV